MGMSVQQTGWTAGMARALPDDGRRYEVLDGELFVSPAPSPRHQVVLARLYVCLHPYVTSNRLGWTLWSPAEVEFSITRLVQPDVFVVPDTGTGEPATWREVTSLLLAVEALSPATARADRGPKRRIYQDQAVPEYWVLDLDARLVERWRPGDERPEILSREISWEPRAGIEPLRIDLNDLFADRAPAL